MITFIIPMYNEENNIQKCIECLLKQTNQSFEVCFIDDGSTDNTILRLEELLQNVNSFKYTILKQDNKGAAAARKLGINNVKTEFLAILDCDDSISPNYVEEMYNVYHKYENIDVLIPDLKIEYKDGWQEFLIYSNSEKLDPVECLKNSLGGWRVHGCLCVKKDIILKGYRAYDEYNPSENFINNDEVITRLVFYFAQNIYRVNKAIYYYHNNENSTTKKVNKNKYLMVNNAKIMKDIFLKFGLGINSLLLEEYISVIWGGHRYKNKNRNALSNLIEWDVTLKRHIRNISISSIFYLRAKSIVQLILLKIFY